MTKQQIIMAAAAAGTLIVLIAVAGVGYMATSKASKRAADFEEQLTAAKDEIAKYAKIGDHLDAAKTTLVAAGPALTTTLVETVERSEALQRGVGAARIDGQVSLGLSVEYTFGFQLGADKLELAVVGKGIEVKLAPPVLTGAPALRVDSFTFPPKAVEGDEETVANEIGQGLLPEFEIKGRALASNEAIRAVCEKKLMGVLREFFEHQPSLRIMPDVRIVYVEAAAKPVSVAPER